MRLSQYILNEGRSVPISKDKAIDFIQTKAKYFLPKIRTFIDGHGMMWRPDWIYRGVSMMKTEPCYIVDPSQIERQSANTSNYYTWIMDNSPHWSGYPKRSRSIICSSSESGAFSSTSDHFMVIPAKGSKIGICPGSDIWESFVDGLGQYDQGNSMADFNDMLGDILGGTSSNTYKDFVQACNHVDIVKSESYNVQEFMNTLGFDSGQYSTFLSDYYFSGLSFYTFLQDLMEPITNKFRLAKVESYKPPDHQEVWTDGESLLVNVPKVYDILGDLL